MFPYCPDCEVFHAPGACDLVAELRASAEPTVSIHQLSLAEPEDVKLICRRCGVARYPAELRDGYCETCALDVCPDCRIGVMHTAAVHEYQLGRLS